jgi:hypothetical protein
MTLIRIKFPNYRRNSIKMPKEIIFESKVHGFNGNGFIMFSVPITCFAILLLNFGFWKF